MTMHVGPVAKINGQDRKVVAASFVLSVGATFALWFATDGGEGLIWLQAACAVAATSVASGALLLRSTTRRHIGISIIRGTLIAVLGQVLLLLVLLMSTPS